MRPTNPNETNCLKCLSTFHPMAQNKKSFLLYADQKALFDSLSDKEAGALIKHIFDYVNDMDPQTNLKILKVAFEPIKNQLRRDLKNWEQTRSKRSEAGKLGGIKSGESRRSEAKRSKASKNEANEAVTVNGTVNVTVTDTVNEKRKREAFSPPAKEDVIQEMCKKLDEFTAMAEGEKFINYYQANGWMVGKHKMKDWKAAVAGWITRMGNYTRAGPQKKYVSKIDHLGPNEW